MGCLTRVRLPSLPSHAGVRLCDWRTWPRFLCHDGVYRDAARAMRATTLPLLHDTSIPFPLYGGVERFPVAVRAALDRLD